MGLRRTRCPAPRAPRPSVQDSRPVARFVLCLALAYLMVVQGVLGAVATGFTAPLAEAGGGVLCLGHGAPGDADGGPPAHDGGCCVLGCVAGGAPLLLTPGRIAFAPPMGEVRPARFASYRPASPARAPTVAFLARGPPRTV